MGTAQQWIRNSIGCGTTQSNQCFHRCCVLHLTHFAVHMLYESYLTTCSCCVCVCVCVLHACLVSLSRELLFCWAAFLIFANFVCRQHRDTHTTEIKQTVDNYD